MKWLIYGLLALFFCVNQCAISAPRYPFQSSAKQQQFERLTHDFRCLVCQNESIAMSQAQLAAQLRQIVYQMVKSGNTDQQIKAYMVARYGNFVLFTPPLIWRTYLLWFGPLLLFLLGLWIAWRVVKKHRRITALAEGNDLSAAELKKLKELNQQ